MRSRSRNEMTTKKRARAVPTAPSVLHVSCACDVDFHTRFPHSASDWCSNVCRANHTGGQSFAGKYTSAKLGVDRYAKEKSDSPFFKARKLFRIRNGSIIKLISFLKF